MDIVSLLNIMNAQDCLKNTSFNNNWPRFQQQILKFLGDYPSKNKIIKLGGELSSIFTKDDSTLARDEAVKTQSDASVSGNAWSRLVTWYLNVCLIGTKCWAVNNSSLMPESVKNALKLTIGGKRVQNSKETVIIGYNGDYIPEIAFPNDIRGIDIKTAYEKAYKDFFKSVKLEDLKVILLSIKTNCSDMIAIPLFWNFCYKSNIGVDVFDIKVGTESETPEMFLGGRVYYSIVTLPSGKEGKINAGEIPGQAALNKLQLLDAGFYWGRHSSDTVMSFDNFINDNLGLMAIDAGRVLSENFEFTNYPRSIFNKMFF